MDGHERVIQDQRAFFSTHQTKNVEFRLEQLRKLKQAIHDYQDEILDAVGKDLDKSPFEAYLTEIVPCLMELNEFLNNLKIWASPKQVGGVPLIPIFKTELRHEPYGVALIISPWNYPFQLCISPLIGAMAAGNCAVLRPSSKSRNTSRVIEKIIKKTFKPGYITVITGDRSVAKKLLNHRWDYIFFTGNPRVGKYVMGKASERLTPVTLELGGKCPVIIDKNARIDVAARRIAWGKFMNAGQTCVAPDHAYVHTSIKKEFITHMQQAIIKMYGQNPLESPDLCHIINKEHFTRISGYLKKEKVVFGGTADQKRLKISPTLTDGMSPGSRLCCDEIFGPLLPILEFQNIDDVIRKINAGEKPLAIYIFTEDKKVQQKVLQQTSSGGACVNDIMLHIIPTELPFGGVGNSGIGKYHGKASFEAFSNTKSTAYLSTLMDPSFRYPPYHKGMLDLIKRVF